MDKNLNWFKEQIHPELKEYKVDYLYFENGDFGNLDRVDFKNEHIGGGIDFWSSGWLGIHLVDYDNDIELINVLLEADEKVQISDHLDLLVNFLLKK